MWRLHYIILLDADSCTLCVRVSLLCPLKQIKVERKWNRTDHTLSLFRFAFPTFWSVYVGLTEQPVNGAKALAVEKIIYHGRYRPRGLDYDIALLKLEQPLNFNGIFNISTFGVAVYLNAITCM